MKTFETYDQLTAWIFRIIDNGGASADRYTVIFNDGSYLALSSYPESPVGVSISDDGSRADLVGYAEGEVESGEAVDLSFYDLPEHIQRHIWARENEGLADFLELIADRNPNSVAKRRDDAETHEGTHQCLGKGLYAVGAGFAIRTDNGDYAGSGEDLGPYLDPAEALRATLPDDYGLAGPEYHSGPGIDAPRDEARLEAVAALEARHEAEHNAERDKFLNELFAD